MHQQQTAFENIVGKGEIARNEQFLLFPQCFLFNQIIVSPFVRIFHIISLFAAELEEHKIGSSGKGLRKINLYKKLKLVVGSIGKMRETLIHHFLVFRYFSVWSLKLRIVC